MTQPNNLFHTEDQIGRVGAAAFRAIFRKRCMAKASASYGKSKPAGSQGDGKGSVQPYWGYTYLCVCRCPLVRALSSRQRKAWQRHTPCEAERNECPGGVSYRLSLRSATATSRIRPASDRSRPLPPKGCPLSPANRLLSGLYYNTFFKNCPVYEFLHFATSSGVPTATTVPPPSPPSGPKSII